jgi:hypothetical protein
LLYTTIDGLNQLAAVGCEFSMLAIRMNYRELLHRHNAPTREATDEQLAEDQQPVTKLIKEMIIIPQATPACWIAHVNTLRSGPSK